MSKIQVVYWSQTGNTQAMAEAVARGIEAAGKEAELVEVGAASLDDLKNASAFAMGCPAMGDEVLEEDNGYSKTTCQYLYNLYRRWQKPELAEGYKQKLLILSK